MKRILYYVSPFVVFPFVFLMACLLEKIDNIDNVVIALSYVVIFSFSALIGSLSTTNKKFDYLMTAIISVSFFFALFLTLLFDKVYEFVRFSLRHALNMEYYKAWLPVVAVMTVITFITSFRPIRLSKRLRCDGK